MIPSPTHLVLLPTYNTGPRLREVVAEVLRHWSPVLVVVDGSTDGSERPLLALAATEPALTVQVLPRNAGKGAAVLAGAQFARARGFTHALVMDADGQHPAASIGEFMAVSLRQPATFVLGRPIFPANIPAERRHGRKLSVGLVHLELMGAATVDPLFGFRVYPLAPLLATLGSRAGGRRYDFDTEAVVRLGWAGVPLLNLAAPVRYFSRAEGGVSHFHYLRDNLLLVWMHTRLLAELLVWRWPAMLRHRREWRTAGAALVLLCAGVLSGPAATEPPVLPEHPLDFNAPEWRLVAAAFARQPDVTADFTERRQFPFKTEAVRLSGVVRVSPTRGLSLQYTIPEARIVILDDRGVLVRAPAGERSQPSDPRAAAVNDALRRILRFDLAGLAHDFEPYGQIDGEAWTLVLVPRTETLRRGTGRITVAGEAATIRRIEIRHSAKQVIEITIEPPRPATAFTAEEVKKYFR